MRTIIYILSREGLVRAKKKVKGKESKRAKIKMR
jgi:hypothetical protein